MPTDKPPRPATPTASAATSPIWAIPDSPSTSGAPSPNPWAIRRTCWQSRSSASSTPRVGLQQLPPAVPELVEAVKRGVLAAGGLPLAFPTISLGEVFLNPTSLMFRNLMAMDTEEMIRAQPMDAVVLVGGCDKTVPAQLMGAASANVPAIQLVTGPMIAAAVARRAARRLHRLPALLGALSRGRGRPRAISSEIEGRLATTAGTCAVMGTASTMACARRGARHDAAGPPRFPASTPTGSAPPRRPARRGVAAREARPFRPRSSPRIRSRTRCACCWRSAARPTP